jgi:NAD kinase
MYLFLAQVAEVAEVGAEDSSNAKYLRYKYPAMRKTLGNFKLHVDEGEFTDSEIIVMLGENGTGAGGFACQCETRSAAVTNSEIVVVLGGDGTGERPSTSVRGNAASLVANS